MHCLFEMKQTCCAWIFLTSTNSNWRYPSWARDAGWESCNRTACTGIAFTGIRSVTWDNMVCFLKQQKWHCTTLFAFCVRIENWWSTTLLTTIPTTIWLVINKVWPWDPPQLCEPVAPWLLRFRENFLAQICVVFHGEYEYGGASRDAVAW